MISIKGRERELVVVSNRLPFSRSRDAEGRLVWEKSAGGLITAMEPILLDANGIWIGWDGFADGSAERQETGLIDVRDIKPGEKAARKRDRSYRMAYVPIGADEVEGYYNHFSNGTLWSLFHYFFEKCFLEYTAWETYCRVNERYARYIEKIASKDDFIWIQDFHLFMVPHYLRKIRPGQEIHFFLHIPFPHIDIFRILPWQEQILDSLLSCNSVGFHHRQYLKNFTEAMEAHEKNRRTEEERTAGCSIKPSFYVNPISVDFDAIDGISRKPEVIARKEDILKQTACPKLILGVDRMDYSKGIRERLLGLELFLDRHPEFREKFFYYQLVIPSREGVEAYVTFKKEIEELIGRVDGKFSTGLWTPVHYQYGTLPLEELVAFYLAADVAIVTPLRDGMNLVCKEYVAAHSDNEGVLILSKFAGAIAEIKNCLAVNPYSVEDIADAIYEALIMPSEERRKRMSKMRRNIRANDINNWFRNCKRYFEMTS